MAKIYIDNAKYMEFISEIATQLTELNFHEDTFESKDSTDTSYGFTDEAQDFYNDRYDEIETLLINTLNIHSNNEFKNDN